MHNALLCIVLAPIYYIYIYVCVCEFILTRRSIFLLELNVCKDI